MRVLVPRCHGICPTESWPKVVRPPATDLVLTVERLPTSHFTVRVRDAALDRWIDDFRIEYRIVDGRQTWIKSKNGVVDQAVELPQGRRFAELELELVAPATSTPVALTRFLEDGGDHEFILESVASEVVRGRVLDAAGKPVVGALVFLGNEMTLRGDEPFKPVRFESVTGASRTGSDGTYELNGSGRQVTVVLDGHSIATAERRASGEIILPALGAIEGRLTTPDGSPISAESITLDRKRKITVGKNGAFRIDAVDAGVRGLHLPGGVWIAVEVRPGETTRVKSLDWVENPRIDRPDAAGEHVRTFGVLVGRRRVSSLVPVIFEGPTPASYAQMLSGEYDLFVEGGIHVQVNVTDRGVTMEGGSSVLTVVAEPGERVHVVPAAANELADLMAGRVAGLRVRPDETCVEFRGLRAGAYRIGTEWRGAFRPVWLDSRTPTKVDLSTSDR